MSKSDDKKVSSGSSNPYDSANVISKYFYWWLRDLFKVGLKRQIIEEDIYECSPKYSSDEVTNRFEKLWENEQLNPKPSLIKVTMKTFWLPVIIVGFFFAVFEMSCKLANPLLLGLLIGYFIDNPHGFSHSDAYLIATGIVLTLAMPILFFHPFMLFLFKQGMKLRIACCSLIYTKILTFTKYTMKDGIAGQAVNLMSNDVSRFDWLMSFTHDIWRPPLAAIGAGYFIFQQVGYAGLLGMAILILFMPLQGWLGQKSASIRLETAQRTDDRVKSMFSIITGIQVIKMYGWEKAFARSIQAVRAFEMSAIAKSYYVRATLLSLVFLPSLALFATLVTYVMMGNSITAVKAFVTIAYFNYVRISLVEFWPMAVTSVAEGWVSLRRVEEFLMQKISNNSSTVKQMRKKSVRIQSLQPGIFMRSATAYWNQNDNSNNVGIVSVDLEITKQSLVAIVGQVGSGKSTLLETILRELPLIGGDLDVTGTLSYASQQAWIFEGSVKNNIVFTEDFDNKRYRSVLHICALERDLELFPHGDETIVGDRGISLSGGQKARINLARAVYKRADIYLLDDPLSAVDAHVGKHIFEKCIREFLKDKICVLVTHQLQYLHDVEHIVIMNAGQVKAQGTYEFIKSRENEFSAFYDLKKSISMTVDSGSSSDEESNDRELKTSTETKKNEEQKVSKEMQQDGKVTSEIYKAYIQAVDSRIFVLFVALLFITAQAMQGTVDFFVSIWVNWEENYGNLEQNNPNDDELTIWDAEWWTTERHVYLYSILILALLILIVSRSFAFYRMCLRVSMNLHDMLFRGVTRATMWFFNQNSTGRVLNRFSKDIGTIDSNLPVVIVDCLQFFFQFATIIIIVAIINPWLLIPTLAMCIIFYVLRHVFLTTARNVKRVEAITRSPLFAHTTSSIEGLSTIRAFGAEMQLRREFYECQNVNTSAWFLFVATSRGFAFWLDVMCVLYVTCVVYSFLFLGSDFVGANVGLAITQAINLIGMCNWGLRQTAELENQMTSVERVIEYANLTSERSLETDERRLNKMPKHWPQRGLIKFNNVSLKYSDTSEYVLHNLSFVLSEREKVGIIGRTGAGKSSMIQAIFHLALVEGSIEIDDVNINTLGLHTFRQKISIIPQDPILFVGSLRHNLDPFSEKNDDELWHVLEQVELKHAIKLLTYGLETKVSDGGSNFSMGQRQLLCLARALLRKNKILILDEATANVDPETDNLIQATIRRHFADCTVLTVAHRLNTVLDSDRIMVLEAGNIVEFDTPARLYENAAGAFRKLVDDAGLNFDRFSRT